LFAPTPDAVANLERLRIKGRVVPLSANTSVEAVRYAQESTAATSNATAMLIADPTTGIMFNSPVNTPRA